MIDFERALLLLNIVVEAGKHGPIYQVLAAEAGNELKAMVEEHKGKAILRPARTTPAAGPANALGPNGEPLPSPVEEEDHSLLNELNEDEHPPVAGGRRV